MKKMAALVVLFFLVIGITSISLAGQREIVDPTFKPVQKDAQGSKNIVDPTFKPIQKDAQGSKKIVDPTFKPVN